MTQTIIVVAAVLVGVLGVIPLIVASFLRNVEAGTIRMVSWLQGGTVIYRGPGKSKEIPLLTTGTTISSKVINVDLDITDQTADIDENGTPQPIKVRVLASAIVSVGDTRRADQDGGEPLLLQGRGRSGEHAHRPALELRRVARSTCSRTTSSSRRRRLHRSMRRPWRARAHGGSSQSTSLAAASTNRRP